MKNENKMEEKEMSELKLSDKIEYWKSFLLNSNIEIHTDKKGVVMIESLVMNNFIIDWFNNFEKDVKEFIKRRLERIDLIINLYPHKSGKELAGELKEDLLNDVLIGQWKIY